MDPTEVEVDVVVPVLNGGERFRRCLNSIAAQRGVRARIIVADNGSTDRSADVARAMGALVVEEPRRSSYAARNRALAEVKAPIVAFTDADCIAAPDWLRTGIDSMTSQDWDLCAAPMLQERASTWAGRYDELTYLSQEQYVKGGFGFGATGNLFVRTSVFAEIGPFLSSLKSGGDMELCLRARAAGKKLGFEPAAVVHHSPRESLAAILKKSWRLGKGHAEVGSYHSSVLRWGLSPKRLLPDPNVIRTHWRRPQVVAIDLVAAWVAWSARVITVVSAGRPEQEETS